MKPIQQKQNKLFHVAGIGYGLILVYVLFLRSLGHDYRWTYMEYLKYMSNFIPFIIVYNLITTPVISTSIVLGFLKNFVRNTLLFIPWGFCFRCISKDSANSSNFL